MYGQRQHTGSLVRQASKGVFLTPFVACVPSLPLIRPFHHGIKSGDATLVLPFFEHLDDKGKIAVSAHFAPYHGSSYFGLGS